jgi:hypothetical protein
MRYVLLPLVAALSCLTGCASIVNGQNQSVSVETRSNGAVLVGANCTLTNDKGTWFVSTPGSATVNRSFEDLSVKCLKDPLDPGLVTVKSATKAMAFGNILFGGVIGAGVDVATGAAYDYPNLISVEMGKTLQLPPPGAAASAPDGAPAAPSAPASPAPAASSAAPASAEAPVAR